MDYEHSADTGIDHFAIEEERYLNTILPVYKDLFHDSMTTAEIARKIKEEFMLAISEEDIEYRLKHKRESLLVT